MTAQTPSESSSLSGRVRTRRVILLCGLPGSGKSSIASGVLRQYDTPKILVIDYDGIEGEFLAKQRYIEKLEAWRASRTEALKRLSTILDDDAWDVTVLLDDNFFLHSMRKQVYQRCQQYVELYTAGPCNVTFGIVWVDTPLELCVKRNQKRVEDQQVSPETIGSMHERWDDPNPSACSWETCFLRLDGSQSVDVNVTQVLDFVETLDKQGKKVECGVNEDLEDQRVIAAQELTRKSLLHNADQFLRACVRLVGKSHPKAARTANLARKSTLSWLQANINWDGAVVLQKFLESFRSSLADDSLDGFLLDSLKNELEGLLRGSSL